MIKTIYLGAFPYIDANGVDRYALRGEQVELGKADLERGERLGAFALPEHLAAGSEFATWLDQHRQVELDEPDPVATQPVELDKEDLDPVEPGADASRSAWVEYARAMGAPTEELAAASQGGLSRDALRTRYGSVV